MKKQSLLGGFASLSAAVLIVKILSMLYIPAIRAILGDEGYGIYYASYQVFIVIYAIANSGVPQAISKLVSELAAVGNFKDALKAFRMSRTILISLGAILAVIYFALSGFISEAVYYPRSYLAILALAPTIFLSTITTAYRGYFQGRGNMMPTAISQVVEQIVNIVFTLLLALLLLHYGLEEAAAGGAFGTSVASMIAALMLINIYNRNRESKIVKLQDPDAERLTNKMIFKKIVQYSIPLVSYALFYNFGNLVDLANVKSRLLFSGLADKEATILFGFFGKYVQLMGIPNAIITSLAVAIMPAISAAAARGDDRDVLSKVNMAFRINFLIAMPSAVGLCILSGPIYRLMMFGGGSYIMLYGAYVLVLMSTVQIFGSILQGLGRLYMVSIFLIFGIAGKIVGNYILVGIPSINILGAVFGNTIYYMIPLVLGNIVLKKTLKLKVNVFVHGVKPLIAALFMGVVVYPVYLVLNLMLGMVVKGYISVAVPALISIAAGAYVYAYVLVRIKGLTKEDMKMLPGRIRRFIPGSIRRHLS